MVQWETNLQAESYKPKHVAQKERTLRKIIGDNPYFLFPNLSVKEIDLVSFLIDILGHK